ncbi:epidermal growth factor receptor kinase substrate 8-like protein 2 isoform X2 [Schistocerca gregaria]|nr:epidermal growth factor receptor kinase substrate 8-like protein 2 isoform X2 [Schistocerca gregaria]XP_049844838.1 epidermal growth factor receptor kinase substrate 8-like protein 2 isoform X2 [Schistocerca gregaria]XP_049844839.1 epidermal growth factor receptor kinase substrate 8-like protein 2 isoform X2 [Schistocerca gregaria]
MPGVRHPSPDESWEDSSYRTSYSSDPRSMYHHSSIHSNGYSGDGQQSVVGEDAPTYVMEHLATFSVSKETGIVYPADGMRRLLQLEKSNGIWSQKMSLRLDRQEVLIMDYETGAVMERFPVALIQEPTAFTSHDPMEIYNNILVFVVGDERHERAGQRSEMHIFQCQTVSAQELVEDLKMLRVGKIPPGRQSRHIPPPPATPPPEPPSNGISVREQVSVFNAAAHQSESRGVPHAELASGMYPQRDDMPLNDDSSSTSSEKYERDVTILNHCFDDIEKFIARLQHAAAASRELERRRRTRKSKKKDLGDGMLTMRAKPPPEAEFVDIFQKFKLSFNLLAKLKTHIHDPNAPELVHFLFTPLALIVDASHDTHYGPNLPAKVVSPLLTQEAVNLLMNCVTSKETELWHSLGDAWRIPSNQWKSYVAPYHPVFLDGWSPEYPVTDEHSGPLSSSVEEKRTHPEDMRAATHEPDLRDQHYHHREPERDDSHYSSDYFDYEQQDASPPDPNRYYSSRTDRYSRDERERSQSPGGSDRDFSAVPSMGGVPMSPRDISSRSDISADSIERTGGGREIHRDQARWLEDLRSRGAKIVQVTYPRTANNDKELTVVRGEFLEVIDDTRKWWKARNIRGQVAHVPHTIVTPYPPGGVDSSDVFSNPLYAPPRGYDRHYASQDSPRDGGSGDGRMPTRSPPIPPPAPADWVRKERLGKKEMTFDSEQSSDDGSLQRSVNHSPPAPPPPPLPVSTPTDSEPKSISHTPRTSTVLSRAPSMQDIMQEELKTVLTLYRGKTRKLDIVKTPEVYIDQKSTPDEVQQWLQEKGFSEKICKQLKGMTGNELFALTRTQLETYCGKTEGHRLDSQITIQRNVSGYKTARSSELSAILARARRKAELATESHDTLDKGYSPPPPPTKHTESQKPWSAEVQNANLFPDNDDSQDNDTTSDSHFSNMLKQRLQEMKQKK